MHDKSELENIVSQLPDLWADYSSKKTAPSYHPYSHAIAQIQGAIGVTSWNGAIAWLDANHPNWRGYPAPQVREVA